MKAKPLIRVTVVARIIMTTAPRSTADCLSSRTEERRRPERNATAPTSLAFAPGEKSHPLKELHPVRLSPCSLHRCRLLLQHRTCARLEPAPQGLLQGPPAGNYSGLISMNSVLDRSNPSEASSHILCRVSDRSDPCSSGEIRPEGQTCKLIWAFPGLWSEMPGVRSTGQFDGNRHRRKYHSRTACLRGEVAAHSRPSLSELPPKAHARRSYLVSSRGRAYSQARAEPVCRCESAPSARCAMSVPERTQAGLSPSAPARCRTPIRLIAVYGRPRFDCLLRRNRLLRIAKVGHHWLARGQRELVDRCGTCYPIRSSSAVLGLMARSPREVVTEADGEHVVTRFARCCYAVDVNLAL